MNIIIAGGSGLIGRELVRALEQRGDRVRRLVRRPVSGVDEIAWLPAQRTLDGRALRGVDVVINLAGENIAAGRWTEARRAQLLQSRVEATSTLVANLTQETDRTCALLNASAVGYYGDRGDELLNEQSDMGHGFLPEVCLAWETHAENAARAGFRTAMLRFGIVLTAKGGALQRMLPLFRAGLGGRLGTGRQWMSWISLTDAVQAVLTIIDRKELSGPINVTAPEPVPNHVFTSELARVLNRPAILPVPAIGLRLAFGRRMAEEALLGSTRAVPEKLMQAGFRFQHPRLADALQAAL